MPSSMQTTVNAIRSINKAPELSHCKYTSKTQGWQRRIIQNVKLLDQARSVLMQYNKLPETNSSLQVAVLMITLARS